MTLELGLEKYDKYGHLLAYVWKGNEMVNATIIKNGHAFAEVVGYNITYAEMMYRLQNESIDKNRGMWGAGKYSKIKAPVCSISHFNYTIDRKSDILPQIFDVDHTTKTLKYKGNTRGVAVGDKIKVTLDVNMQLEAARVTYDEGARLLRRAMQEYGTN